MFDFLLNLLVALPCLMGSAVVVGAVGYALTVSIGPR
jgi:hypothetical protein